MLSTAAKQTARLEINALCSLGFTRSDAIGMTAKRLRKSLPTIDTTAADARWKARCKKEEDTEEPKGDKAKAAAKTIQMRKYITDKVKRVSGVMLTKYRNGSILVKPMNSPPPDYDPGFNTDQQKQMLEMAISHLSIKRKGCGKPDTTKDKEEDTTMKKSNRLEKLIARAKADPSKLQTQTIQALNQHLVSQGKEPITKPIPQRSWFRPQTLAEIGADRDARAAHMPPVAPVKMPSLKDARMTTAEIQQYRLEQALKQEAVA